VHPEVMLRRSRRIPSIKFFKPAKINLAFSRVPESNEKVPTPNLNPILKTTAFTMIYTT